MKSANPINLIGYASGNGAGNSLCEKGPIQMQASPYLKEINARWYEILTPTSSKKGLDAEDTIAEISSRLAKISYTLTKNQQFFVTIGGDHSSAIGTWSGVAAALFPKTLGLLWIDAHLDSHTDKTTPSGNIHGMPLAALLGFGKESFTHLLSDRKKLSPENVCVIGVRSYEKEERELLEKLNVRIFYMDEIRKRGFQTIFDEAINIVSKNTDFYGISLDLDGIDPIEAPGVGTPEANGIALESLKKALEKITRDPKLVAAEIAEFNPSLDKDHKTEKIIADLLKDFSVNYEKRKK